MKVYRLTCLFPSMATLLEISAPPPNFISVLYTKRKDAEATIRAIEATGRVQIGAIEILEEEIPDWQVS